MLTIYSFLQNVFHFVKNMAVQISKKMYRSAAVFSTGLTVVLVVVLTSTGFGGGGKNALTAFAETRPTAGTEKETETAEETELITEANIRANLTDSRREGQLVVGELLAQEIQREKENQLTAQAEIEQIREKIRLEAEEESRRLAEEEARQAAAVVSYSEQDYQVLLRIVQAEAGICDTKGKILVANVIINRVKDGRFPNNITDVVYQKSQFSPVSNGKIDTVTVTSQTVECVERALTGEDYSQGALYFMYRGASKTHAVKWFDRRLTFLFQHERHEFFK